MPKRDAALTLGITENVAVVTMSRPPVNALDAAFRGEIIDMFDHLSDRDEVRAVVLCSSLKVFSAGADLKSPAPANPGDWGHRHRLSRETKNSIRECSKPVIAAVNGAALGAGFGLAGACDILLASEEAVFGMPEIDVGLAGGASLLNEYLGRSRRRRMMFTGMRVTADEMFRLGVIEACLKKDDLLPAALDIANEIASKSPRGIKYAKRSLNLVELMSPRDSYRFEQDFTVELSRSADSEEVRELPRGRRQVDATDVTPTLPDAGPIGIIGFGTMGLGLARSLMRAGRNVIAYDAQKAKAAVASETGVAFANGIAEVCAESDVIILVLPNGPDVLEVTHELTGHARRGTLVIDCSTIDPEASREAAQLAEVSGLEFADAGMGGGASDAMNGSLLFMVGCSEQVWPSVEAILRPIGRDVVRCGSAGTGVTLKAITNLLWLANYTADVEAIAFAKAAGVSPNIAADVLSRTGATNRAIAMVVEQLLIDDFKSGFPVSLAHKDVSLAIAAANRLGLDLEALKPALATYDEAVKAGMGDLGVASGGLTIEERLGIDLSEEA